jgi:hypothetical protein
MRFCVLRPRIPEKETQREITFYPDVFRTPTFCVLRASNQTQSTSVCVCTHTSPYQYKDCNQLSITNYRVPITNDQYWTSFLLKCEWTHPILETQGSSVIKSYIPKNVRPGAPVSEECQLFFGDFIIFSWSVHDHSWSDHEQGSWEPLLMISSWPLIMRIISWSKFMTSDHEASCMINQPWNIQLNRHSHTGKCWLKKKPDWTEKKLCLVWFLFKLGNHGLKSWKPRVFLVTKEGTSKSLVVCLNKFGFISVSSYFLMLTTQVLLIGYRILYHVPYSLSSDPANRIWISV